MRKATVDTVKKSTAAMSLMWLSMKIFQVWDGGLPFLIMYCSTVDLAACTPSNANSSDDPRRAPERILARHASDQLPDLGIDSWPPRFTRP